MPSYDPFLTVTTGLDLGRNWSPLWCIPGVTTPAWTRAKRKSAQATNGLISEAIVTITEAAGGGWQDDRRLPSPRARPSSSPFIPSSPSLPAAGPGPTTPPQIKLWPCFPGSRTEQLQLHPSWGLVRVLVAGFVLVPLPSSPQISSQLPGCHFGGCDVRRPGVVADEG